LIKQDIIFSACHRITKDYKYPQHPVIAVDLLQNKFTLQKPVQMQKPVSGLTSGL